MVLAAGPWDLCDLLSDLIVILLLKRLCGVVVQLLLTSCRPGIVPGLIHVISQGFFLGSSGAEIRPLSQWDLGDFFPI